MTEEPPPQAAPPDLALEAQNQETPHAIGGTESSAAITVESSPPTAPPVSEEAADQIPDGVPASPLPSPPEEMPSPSPAPTPAPAAASVSAPEPAPAPTQSPPTAPPASAVVVKEIIREVPVEKIVERVVEKPVEVVREAPIEKIIEKEIVREVKVFDEVQAKEAWRKQAPSYRAASLSTRQRKRVQKLERILAAAREKESVTNDEAQILLGVSDRTATRYLSVLAAQGKLKKRGTGRATTYHLP